LGVERGAWSGSRVSDMRSVVATLLGMTGLFAQTPTPNT
jgi:hypothetical protein